MNIETMRLLVAKGMSAEDLLEIAETMAVRIDRTAAERQARHRAKVKTERGDVTITRDVTRDVTRDGNADPALSRPPNEINNSNPPTHTHPEHKTRAHEGNGFPRPIWCADQLWRDLKSNRKAKHLACTPTAHAKLLRDIEKYTDDEWPPGRVLEAAVARGWAAVPSDPRDDRTPRNERPANQHFSGNSTLQELAERSIASG